MNIIHELLVFLMLFQTCSVHRIYSNIINILIQFPPTLFHSCSSFDKIYAFTYLSRNDYIFYISYQECPQMTNPKILRSFYRDRSFRLSCTEDYTLWTCSTIVNCFVFVYRSGQRASYVIFNAISVSTMHH